ncbi:MAG: DUF4230 domain-containing protein [Sphingobium sp.]
MKKMIGIGVLCVVLFAATFGGAYFYAHRTSAANDDKVKEAIATALTNLKDEPRLSAFAASFVGNVVLDPPAGADPAVVRQVLLVPGSVRYEIDLNALKSGDAKWNDQSKSLRLTLPPFILSGPDIDFQGVRNYRPDAMLTAVADARNVMGDSGVKAAKGELLKQAWGDTPMRLARDATRHVFERNFSEALRTAGIKADVKAKFADEAGE